jgi:pimeloyl-ACP methyl ester carboxylesterase
MGEISKRQSGPLTLVGLRLGAAIALLESNDGAVEKVILWDAVVSGRRLIREIKMLKLAGTVRGDGSEDATDAVLEVAGAIYHPTTLVELSKIDLLKADCPGLRKALVVHRDDRPISDVLRKGLERQGVEVTELSLPGTREVLDVPTEDAAIPERIVEAIVEDIAGVMRERGTASPPAAPDAAREHALLEWAGGRIIESAIRLGEPGLFGMLGRPERGQKSDWVVVFINGGIEHHVGPGRAWVEFARALNTRGWATVRLDLDGVGDSPRRGPPRVVRPYDAAFLEDVDDAVASLRRRGYAKVAVLGLCSGAWTAVQAGCRTADAVCAINPQLYWNWGQPVEALLSETRVRRADERRLEEWGGRCGLWSALDALRIRPPAARWLECLASRRVPALLAFAAGDDGIEYLENRCHRRLSSLKQRGAISVVEIEGIDHPMHRHQKRPEMLAAIATFLDGLRARNAQGESGPSPSDRVTGAIEADANG